MDVTVKLVSGETRAVRVGTRATVGELYRAVAQCFNVPEARVRLSTNTGLHVNLDNKLTPLSSCGLSSGSTVMLLILTAFQIIVKNEKGQNKTYDVSEEDTVADLQRKIYKTENISEDQQRLIYNGLQLDAGQRLKDYKIQSGDTVYMNLRLRGGQR